VDRPTRDVLVVYRSDGDRQFVGFGGPNNTFADAVISADELPLDALQNAAALVTGTLGLNFPVTAAAMNKAVDTAKTGAAVVSTSAVSVKVLGWVSLRKYKGDPHKGRGALFSGCVGAGGCELETSLLGGS
jgi:sugar/nucleoside kinase (ribokinase family)